MGEMIDNWLSGADQSHPSTHVGLAFRIIFLSVLFYSWSDVPLYFVHHKQYRNCYLMGLFQLPAE
jgi:hypothetical protein